MRIKTRIRKFAYDIIKWCPPLRKIFRDVLFARRRWVYERQTKGLAVDDKLVCFCVFSGKGYSDSPRAIYEYMLNNPKYTDYKYIWIFRDLEKYAYIGNNRNTKIVKWNSRDFKNAMASSKYWIFNYRVSDHIYPKPEQVYVECWHGTPLKRLGYDLINSGNVMNTISEIREKYDLDAAKFKYIISPSPYCSEKFTSAWNLKAIGKESSIIEQGYPRNDFLINATAEQIEAIKSGLKITPEHIGNKKIILYAPTWRDNQHDSSEGYSYKLGLDFEHLREALSDEYIVLFRAHYLVASQFNFDEFEGFIYNVSSYPDINELYLAADLLVTDYSSVFFDYANLRKPILFYMYDLADYRDDIRGFYIGLEELPGEITETEDEFIAAIPRAIGDPIGEKYEEFLRKFAPYDDGKASERVTRVILGESDKRVHDKQGKYEV